MLKAVLRTLAVALACLCTPALAGDATGVWQYDGMPDSQVIICQDQGRLVITGHHGLNGQPAAVISYGEGRIQGDRINVKFKVVRRPNGTWGGASGITFQDLVLSPDGNAITGTWRNDTGQGAAATLRRVR
jgi:hypothetical protein